LFTARRNGARYAIVLANNDAAPPPESVTVPENLLERGGRISLLPFDETLSSEAAAQGQCRVRLPTTARAKLPPGMAWVIRVTPISV